MIDKKKLAAAKDWAEGQRKGAPNWYGLTLLDALTEVEAEQDRLRDELQTINYRALSAIQAYFDDERESEIYTRMEELQDVLQEAKDERQR